MITSITICCWWCLKNKQTEHRCTKHERINFLDVWLGSLRYGKIENILIVIIIIIIIIIIIKMMLLTIIMIIENNNNDSNNRK